MLDSYSVDTSPPALVLLEGTAPPAVTDMKFDQSTSIVGGERDVILTAEVGTAGLVFTAGASGGVFSISTPNNGNGLVVLQYDGVDGSPNLDTAVGLNGFDLTEGNAVGFRLEARTDIDTEFTLAVFDTNGRSVQTRSTVDGGNEVQSYLVFFSDFQGNLDFASVSAIEFEIEAFDSVDFNLVTFVTFTNIIPPPVLSDCFNGTVAPCLTNYYRLEELTDIQPGDYITLEYFPQGEPAFPNSMATFYVLASVFEDLETELQQNTNIISTLGGLPGATQYDYICDGECTIEIVWSALQNITYYLAVEGMGPGFTNYEICLARSQVPITPIFDNTPEFFFNVTRGNNDTLAENQLDDAITKYAFYSFDVPQELYREGSYIQISIFGIYPGNSSPYTLRLMHESLPEEATDTGKLGAIDFNSKGERVDDMIWPYCKRRGTFDIKYTHPVSIDPTIPCKCDPEIKQNENPDDDDTQDICSLTVDPCHFRYGTWYISVELPPNEFIFENQTFALRADFVRREVERVDFGVVYNQAVEPEYFRHFRVNIPEEDIHPDMGTHLLVKILNVSGGSVTSYVHQGQGNFDTLAGGIDGCSAANATCTTCDACNIIVEKCHFAPGNWYISVGVAHDEDFNYMIDSDDRYVKFSVGITWEDDPIPQTLIAGHPVSTSVHEGLYHFYVINVPHTIDTMLYIELFAKANDTEVSMAVLHGDIPGGECYERPDFYCLTGDVRGIRSSYGPTSFIDNEGIQRESCQYQIEACELTPGPLYISVYGHRTGYVPYGDTTFYGIPVHYTLYAEFSTPFALTSGVSMSEVVYEGQYQHYYIRADEIIEGQWLSVEVTNIKHGVPQTIEAYVNYNLLAGDCPCYDNIFTCTDDTQCRPNDINRPYALPDIESVDNCCTILVNPSDFASGIWYISVRGVNEDYFQYTTPIGYTLTVTIHDAPQYTYLPLGQHFQGLAPRWNRTFEYSHFILAAEAMPLNDLVIKLTWAQNCDLYHGGVLSDSWEALTLFVNHLRTAGSNPSGHIGMCTATTSDDSYCTVVIPHCQWLSGEYFISVRGDYESDFDARFTLYASSEEVRDVALVDGIPYYDRVHENLYKHYYIHTDAEEDKYLAIDVYTNQDQDAVTVALNKDQRAGSSPCFTNTAMCHTQSCCSFQIGACELTPGRYYISVGGAHSQFYYVSTEFTITAAHHQVVTPLFDETPMTGHLSSMHNAISHYSFEVDQLVPGHALRFTVDSVKHGSVYAYSQFESLAGRCPCYTWDQSCQTTMDKDWCSIRYAPCELHVGTYYFSVAANQYMSPDPPVFMTPIGYTVEIQVEIPTYVDIEVDIGREEEDRLSQSLSASHYRHYDFSWDDDDASQGYHLIVEITNVRNGEIDVYYNAKTPGDEHCHDAQICNSGIGSGADCYWQLPYCLTRPLDDPINHYISIVNTNTGSRENVDYEILIWKQQVPVIVDNPHFTLDNGRSPVFANSQEYDVVHDPFLEPNGWTQFFFLPAVDLTLDVDGIGGRGEILELFFYRISNNFGQPMSFNVYLHPEEPAGAHECCSEERGSCQGAPCSHTADTSTLVNGNEVFTHTCNLPDGIGHDQIDDSLFGEECIVRVWPCELAKYCNGEKRNWFVSVVPIAPTCVSSEGPGLTYSFQWRTRVLRNFDENQNNVGTIDLEDAVNIDRFTPPFDVVSISSESEGWRSFFVPFTRGEDGNSRLSIQTRFLAGQGIVYIQRDEFASAMQCNDYYCTNEMNCDGEDRFVVTECCSAKEEIGYFITLRNTGPVGSVLSAAFQILTTPLPSTIQIEDHPSVEEPYIIESFVAPENYDFYRLTIDDDDIERDRSWIIEIERFGNSTAELATYIRFGSEAGLYATGSASNFYDGQAEGCHGWQYSCTMSPSESFCFYQIPGCDLIEGHWYISVYNPAPAFSRLLNDDAGYRLVTYIDNPATQIRLNEPLMVSSVNSTFVEHNVEPLMHFSVNLTANSGGFDDRDDVESYWTRYLRFQVDFIQSGEIRMWVNYDTQAGPSGDGFTCLGSIGARDCDVDTGCYFDVLPCVDEVNQFKLVTGVYNIALQLSEPTDFQITAHVVAEPYTIIEVDHVEEGIVQRTGTENIYWTYNVTQAELNTRGDGEGNYRYVIDILNSETDDDDMEDNQYLLFNVTAPSFNVTAGDTLHMEVFRDDCTRFSCDLDGPLSWCTIDALTLGPCSLKGGRYYINVVNPIGMPFAIEAFLNETIIVPIQDRQQLTEFMFPYEYQEYFYDAHDVGQGATLEVNICSICGQVEAWIRPDLPAGPTPDVTGEENSCSIDYCRTDLPANTAFGNLEGMNCCQMFLDTCVYEQRGYYVGVRGVSAEYPVEGNQILYLPIIYNIEFQQTTVNFTEIKYAQCTDIVSYVQPVEKVPRQFTFDLETVPIGSSLRITLIPYLSMDNEISSVNPATVRVQFNHSLGYSDECPDAPELSCEATSDDGYCTVIIPYCRLPWDASRIYILTDAPRGSEVLVERYDPIVPVIHPDVMYTSSVNGRIKNELDRTYQPSTQYYRFDVRPHHDDYSRFFIRVVVDDIEGGSVSVAVNSGQYPFTGCGSSDFVFLDTTSCRMVDDKCHIDIEWSDVMSQNRFILDPPYTYWIAVTGESQDCELNHISYNVVAQTNFAITYYPVGETVCGEVGQGDYVFHRITPDAVESPQLSFLRLTLTDIDEDESATLLMQQGRVATRHSSSVTLTTNGGEPLIEDYFCGYDHLYVSVYGEDANSDDIDYRLSIEKKKLRVKELFDDSTYSADDDDDDACPHPHDFYRFRLPSNEVPETPEGSFFRVAVDSEFPTEVYVNRGSVAWKNCYNAAGGSNDPRLSGTTTVNVYDFCDYEDVDYYITVISDGPYYIYTDVRDDPKELTIGEVFRDTLEPAMYQVYTLEICSDWFEADDRLVVEITDVENGDVFGWIGYEQVPGMYNHSDDSDSCAIDFAKAEYGPGDSGYDFLLVNTCELKAGTYYILIRASPHSGSPVRDCEHVNYRLYPYLIDYQIDPEVILPNSVIHDSVDYYTINRIDESSVEFINYYMLTPHREDEGFIEQISHAVARLANVDGGLLRLRVMCDHLAIAEFGYFDGEIYGLSKEDLVVPEWKMQSGSRPFTYQRMLDPRHSVYQPECDGCTDFCCEMTYDDIEEYQTDRSCAVWIPSCYLVFADLYLAVEPVVQYSQDHVIRYDLAVHQSSDFTLLEPNTQFVSSFNDDNWDYDFVYSLTAESESMRWRFVITEGEGILVTVRNHRCPLQATWTKQIWCDAAYFDRPWMCDIEVPTHAAHPGTNYFFLSIYGKNATYSLTNFVGRENCHAFVGSGRNDGLDFCAGLLPYAVWRWDNYDNLDFEARCLFEQLYLHFQVQPCWQGVTPECNTTLAAFACYETFHRCDEFGFEVPTCRQACDAVESECFNTFDAVDLEHYTCSSSRYGDGYSQTCSMSQTLLDQSIEAAELIQNPALADYVSSPDSYAYYDYADQSSASTLTSVSFVFLISLFVLLF